MNILENIKIPVLKKEKTETTASTKIISTSWNFHFSGGEPGRNICQMMLGDMNRRRGRAMKPVCGGGSSKQGVKKSISDILAFK